MPQPRFYDVHKLEEELFAMVAEGRGILAADESNATMTKRLEAAAAERDSGQPADSDGPARGAIR